MILYICAAMFKRNGVNLMPLPYFSNSTCPLLCVVHLFILKTVPASATCDSHPVLITLPQSFLLIYLVLIISFISRRTTSLLMIFHQHDFENSFKNFRFLISRDLWSHTILTLTIGHRGTGKCPVYAYIDITVLNTHIQTSAPAEKRPHRTCWTESH